MGKQRKIRGDRGRARLSLCSILFLSALAAVGESRLALSPYLDCSYSDNIFWDRSRVGDTILSPGLGIDLSGNSWNVFLNADGRIYRSNDYLSSAMFSGGASFFKIFSPRTSLYVSPEFSLTRYHADTSVLDTAVPSISFGVKHSLSDRVSGRLGLGLSYGNYLTEDSYDRFRVASFLELSAFFVSQTTLRFTLGMNYLLFPHVGTPDASSGNQQQTPVPGSGPRGQRHGPADAPAAAGASTIDLAVPQPYVILRIAQGLGFKTGVVAEFLVRKNLAPLEGMQALAADEWALEQTAEDFFWEGSRLSLGIKTEALLGLEIAVDISFLKKEYQGIEALDMDGIPIQPLSFRSDTLAQANARISKRCGAFALFVGGSYRKNHSNDLYFQYDFFTISAGLDLAI